MKASLPILLLCASACSSTVSSPPHARASVVPRVQVEAVMEAAARQVRRCYRSPRIATAGRQIVTRVRVRFTGDGQLAQLPIVVAQEGVTPGNSTYAGRMAEAAIEAVMRCAPLHLPEGLPQTRTVSFDLTFSPLAPA